MTGAGIEPAARALKVRCSTTELPGRGSKHEILPEESGGGRGLNLWQLRAVDHFFQRFDEHGERVRLLNEAGPGAQALELC